MKAYILLKVRPGDLNPALEQIRKIRGVQKAQMVFGPYDAVIEVEAADLNSLGKIIAREIQPVPGVRETLTCIASEI